MKIKKSIKPEEIAIELAMKITVQSDGIIIHEKLKQPYSKLSIKEVCLFAIITDCNLKQIVFNESDIVGKYGFENLNDVIKCLDKLRKKGFISYEQKFYSCGSTQIIYWSKALDFYSVKALKDKYLNTNEAFTDKEREYLITLYRLTRCRFEDFNLKQKEGKDNETCE